MHSFKSLLLAAGTVALVAFAPTTAALASGSHGSILPLLLGALLGGGAIVLPLWLCRGLPWEGEVGWHGLIPWGE
jgi:hypothetical protein